MSPLPENAAARPAAGAAGARATEDRRNAGAREPRPAEPPAPEPLERGDLAGFLADRAAGVDVRAALEALLLALPLERAEHLMLAMKEGRGAWHPLLAATGGRALLLGNALSGTVPPLVDAGFDVVVVDDAPERLAFARARRGGPDELELRPAGRVHTVRADPRGPLPFVDRGFALVVVESGLPGRCADPPAELAEPRRVCAGELVLVADNRLGYKRSTGTRSVFRVPGPLEWLRDVVANPRGLHDLRGYRRLVERAGFGAPRAFALYPHSRDFTHVVALPSARTRARESTGVGTVNDARAAGAAPRLVIGPRERENKLKLFGHALGLFPVLTPSFAVIARRPDAALPRAPRVARWLAALARRLDEPVPEVEHLHATRGNTCLLLTRVPGAPPADPRGRWAVHVPLKQKEREHLEVHHRRVATLRERFPAVPVSQPLFAGSLAEDGAAPGPWLACERRFGGLTAPQVSARPAAAAALFAGVSRHFAELVVAPPRPVDDALFAELVAAKLELVARYVAVPEARDWLARQRAELFEALVGRPLPRVLQHGDLRGKHVQVERDGRVIAYLDWGSSFASDLPYFDLLHLLVHERKQATGCAPAAAWHAVRERTALAPHERACLDDYAARLGLEPPVCRALERAYPALVAAMAEQSWDYSRPRWLWRQYLSGEPRDPARRPRNRSEP